VRSAPVSAEDTATLAAAMAKVIEQAAEITANIQVETAQERFEVRVGVAVQALLHAIADDPQFGDGVMVVTGAAIGAFIGGVPSPEVRQILLAQLAGQINAVSAATSRIHDTQGNA
jgi:hypothetical protein